MFTAYIFHGNKDNVEARNFIEDLAQNIHVLGGVNLHVGSVYTTPRDRRLNGEVRGVFSSLVHPEEPVFKVGLEEVVGAR